MALRINSAIYVLAAFAIIAPSFVHTNTHLRRAAPSLKSEHNEKECHNCAHKKQEVEAAHSNEKMISIRTKIIKDQILQKLRLSKPPKIRNAIPGLLKEFLNTDHPTFEDSSTAVNKRNNELYGKVVRVAVLPETIVVPSPHSSYPSALLSFRLADILKTEQLKSGELWFYNANGGGKRSHTMTIWEIVNEKNISLSKRFIAKNKECKSLSWEKVKASIKSSTWIPQEHYIEITCSSCNQTLGPIGTSEDNKPFLVIHSSGRKTLGPIGTPEGNKPLLLTHPNKKALTYKNRSSTICGDPNSKSCCVQPLFVNFTEIGWDDWIVQPYGYYANYCRGHCKNDIDSYRRHHTTIMRELILKQKEKSAALGLGIHCVPSKMSSQSIVHRQSEDRIVKVTLADMVVEECECI